MNHKYSNILIVVATKNEIQNFVTEMNAIINPETGIYSYSINNKCFIDLIITGVGIPQTIYALTKQVLQKKYDLVINAGIAGSFSEQLPVGTVVNIISECFADIGICENGNFHSLFNKGFLNDDFPYKNQRLLNNNDFEHLRVIHDLPKVTGITVNTVSDEINRIEEMRTLYEAQIESMEGAAVFYVCILENIPFIEIRCVSNYVAPRAVAQWDIPLSISNLNAFLKDFLLLIARI